MSERRCFKPNLQAEPTRFEAKVEWMKDGVHFSKNLQLWGKERKCFSKTASHSKHVIIFIGTSKEKNWIYDSVQLNLCQWGFDIRHDLLQPRHILVEEKQQVEDGTLVESLGWSEDHGGNGKVVGCFSSMPTGQSADDVSEIMRFFFLLFHSCGAVDSSKYFITSLSPCCYKTKLEMRSWNKLRKFHCVIGNKTRCHIPIDLLS